MINKILKIDETDYLITTSFLKPVNFHIKNSLNHQLTVSPFSLYIEFPKNFIWNFAESISQNEKKPLRTVSVSYTRPAVNLESIKPDYANSGLIIEPNSRFANSRYANSEYADSEYAGYADSEYAGYADLRYANSKYGNSRYANSKYTNQTIDLNNLVNNLKNNLKFVKPNYNKFNKFNKPQYISIKEKQTEESLEMPTQKYSLYVQEQPQIPKQYICNSNFYSWLSIIFILFSLAISFFKNFFKKRKD